MNDQAIDLMIRSLGMRNPLRQRDWFAGRRGELRRIRGELEGGSCSVWLYGPRRIGKSSLTCRISEWESVDVLMLDAGAEGIRTAEQLILRIIERLNAGGANVSRTTQGLRAHVDKRSRPLVVVVDEFDDLAMSLGKTEQATLRGLSSNSGGRLGWVFVTRCAPQHLCQKHDALSWLVLVCRPYLLGALTRADVGRLVGLACDRADLPFAEEWTTMIFDAVGGHPISVHSLLRELMLAVSEGEDLEWTFKRARVALEMDIECYWRDLTVDVRAAFLERADSVGLERAGLLHERRCVEARWVREIASAHGPVPRGSADEALGLAEAISDLMYRCNDLGRRICGQLVFDHADRMLLMFQLARPVTSEPGLRSVVGLLYQLVCEGTPKSDPLPDSRLRGAWQALRASSAWGALTVARNLAQGEPSLPRSASQAVRHDEADADLCRRYVGKPAPDAPADFRCYQMGLLADVESGLRDVLRWLERQS